jgi:transcription antitermination factor NusG
MAWYVLYTKPRNEKKLAARLESKGITAYCPMQEVVKQWSDRKKKVLEPVFRSYIFVSLEEYDKEQTSVLETQGAVRFLWWLKKPGVVRDEEIEAIRNFLNNYKGAHLTVTMEEGMEVVIRDGVLKEQTGKIVKIKGNRAILELKSLGWNIKAELPVHSLEKK